MIVSEVKIIVTCVRETINKRGHKGTYWDARYTLTPLPPPKISLFERERKRISGRDRRRRREGISSQLHAECGD